MTLIIGLCGAIGSGKSTLANYLVEKHGAKRYSIAAALKDIAQRTLDFSHEQLWGTQAQKEAIDPRYGFSPRWFLQKLGTEGIRSVLGADTWINATMKRIEADRPAIAVVDDVRFANEAAEIGAPEHWDLQGQIWRLFVDGEEVRCSHASEAEWLSLHANVDITAKRGDVEALQQAAEWLMECYACTAAIPERVLRSMPEGVVLNEA